jgi:hypothetical protein
VFVQPWPAGPADKRRDHTFIYQYRADRARRTLRGIDQQVAKAEKAVAGKTAVKRNRYVRLTGATKTVDRALEAKNRALAGIKGYVINLPDPDPDPDRRTPTHHNPAPPAPAASHPRRCRAAARWADRRAAPRVLQRNRRPRTSAPWSAPVDHLRVPCPAARTLLTTPNPTHHDPPPGGRHDLRMPSGRGLPLKARPNAVSAAH